MDKKRQEALDLLAEIHRMMEGVTEEEVLQALAEDDARAKKRARPLR